MDENSPKLLTKPIDPAKIAAAPVKRRAPLYPLFGKSTIIAPFLLEVTMLQWSFLTKTPFETG